MAVPSKEMKALTAADIDALIQKLESELSTTWAVYGEYDDRLRWKVARIIPWAERDYDSEPIKIENAFDVLDAYKKVMERLL